MSVIEAAGLLLAIVLSIILWAFLGQRLGRGHLGVDRSTGHHLSEQETRRHLF